MSDVLTLSESILSGAGFVTKQLVHSGREYLVFEDPTVLGFLFVYPTPDSLLSGWSNDIDRVVGQFQFQLRKSGQKAWNVYAVLLALEEADYPKSVRLGAVEEDLTGTRKIVRSGVGTVDEVRAALLPLVALQNAPLLGPVDIANEIRLRTTELPSRVVDAFLSDAEEAVVVQVLEEEK